MAVRKKVEPKKRKSAIVIWKNKKDKKFYYHLKGSNGRILLADSGGFDRRNDLIATLQSVSEIFRDGRFVIVDPTLPQELAAA